MVKLSDRKIRWIVTNIDKGKTTTRAASTIYGITMRRVQQLIKEHRETGKSHILNRKRRPETILSEVQKTAIEEAWEDSRLGARLLYWELKKRGHSISKNKIHRYLTGTGKTMPDPNKQKKRKRCRYEREHTFSLLHMDWTEYKDMQVIAVEDDASRKILSIGEFCAATTDHAISVLKEVEKEAMNLNSFINEVNTDRGPQFYANKWTGKGEKGVSEFEKYLDSKGIKHIPSRRRNPQTNGKIERWFQEYKKHRHRFTSAQEFASWYNRRIHGALLLEYGETPSEAFMRKQRPEVLVGLFSRMVEG